MADDALEPVVVFSTGQVWQVDAAVEALKAAGIPYAAEEEAGGVRLAMPVAPAAAPGVCWTIRVPAARADRARDVLSELPFEVKTNPGPWDFKPTRTVERVWRAAIVALLALGLLYALVRVATAFR